MSIGYACLLLGAPDIRLRTCALKNASQEKLHELIAHNLKSLNGMLEYNINNHIRLFRISSDIIPFGSHPQGPDHWESAFGDALAELGAKALSCSLRLSMHPGQYTVLNSPDENVYLRSVEDLRYHCRFLDAMRLGPEHKLVLHIGGVYGDKAAAINRFIERSRKLDDNILNRLVIENDDKNYNAEEVLSISEKTGLPAIFDNLHHQIVGSGNAWTEAKWIEAFAATWQPKDGKQKIHYAQQDPGKKPGSHSTTIRMDEFLAFWQALPGDPDIMLEVKDKNISALNCIAATAPNPAIQLLEQLWARYKYAVMEHSQNAYNKIRQLLKDKNGYPAKAFFQLVESAMVGPVTPGAAVNTAQHIWGYFNKEASEAEKNRFHLLLTQVQESGAILPLKRFLWRLTQKYNQPYLLASYYFLDCQ